MRRVKEKASSSLPFSINSEIINIRLFGGGARERPR
jgi:hypothetical protein